MLEYIHQKHTLCKTVIRECKDKSMYGNVPVEFFIDFIQALFNYFFCYWVDFLVLALNLTSTSYSGDYTLMV